MVKTLIKLENVSKIFTLGIMGGARITAVDDISMDIRRGEILGILGESGSGKSTIAKLILKIIKPTAGRILYEDMDVWKIDTREYYKKVQGVFQDPYASFNPRRKVLDILLDTIRNYYPEEHKWMEKITDVLNRVGISKEDVVGKYPHEFSGGQLQRISIARALLVKPDVIIADEPVSMVDASTRIDILNIFLDLREQEKLTYAIIGHDLGLTQYVSDRVVVLYRGQIMEQGPADILRDPAHPYTKMLLEAVPRVEFKWGSQLKYGVESVEKGDSGDTGCVFASRCPSKMGVCSYLRPPAFNMGYSQVRCWQYAPK